MTIKYVRSMTLDLKIQTLLRRNSAITFYKYIFQIKIINMSVIDENWDYRIDLNDIAKRRYREFSVKFDNKCKSFNIIEVINKGFQSQNYNCNGNTVQSHDEKLKALIENNMQQRSNIDIKLKELTGKQAQYENFKRDKKMLSQEIKETHEAFLMAKKYYKKYLNMYYTIELKNNNKETVFIQFFTEAKKDSENYSIRLLRDTKTTQYELLSTTPKLAMQKELQRKLQETNDLSGALCCIRQAFITLKKSK